MTRAAALFAVCIAFGTGCDLVVGNGETTVLGNRGAVFGSATPNAVNVRPGGTLIVEDADLFGRGRIVNTLPAGPFPSPGAAIEADRGVVRIQKGRIAGGNVVLNVDPSSFPVPPPPESTSSAKAFAALVGVPIESAAPLAPALSAVDSQVEIAGGTLVGSGVFGQPNPYFPAPATVSVFGGRLRIQDGEFLLGTMQPPSPLSFGGTSLQALAADIEISGGNFDAAPVLLGGSQTRITGGRFGAGLFLSSVSPLIAVTPIGLPDFNPFQPGCAEIRGGTFSRIAVGGPDRVFIFGTQFNVPFGPVTSPGGPPSRFGPPPAPLALSGVFADGSPFQLALTAPAGTQVTLVAPGDPGCALIILD